jgi:hypothetical protein
MKHGTQKNVHVCMRTPGTCARCVHPARALAWRVRARRVRVHVRAPSTFAPVHVRVQALARFRHMFTYCLAMFYQVWGCVVYVWAMCHVVSLCVLYVLTNLKLT